jgi:hypothetical protein
LGWFLSHKAKTIIRRIVFIVYAAVFSVLSTEDASPDSSDFTSSVVAGCSDVSTVADPIPIVISSGAGWLIFDAGGTSWEFEYTPVLSSEELLAFSFDIVFISLVTGLNNFPC